MRTGTITWDENEHGIGTLYLRWDDTGETVTIHHEDPINSRNASDIAAKFGFNSSELNGEWIHVSAG